MKKIYSVIILTVLLFTGCSNSQVNTDSLGSQNASDKPVITSMLAYQSYESVVDLAEDASDIVMGRIIGSKVEELDITAKVSEEDKDNEALNPGGEQSPSLYVYTIFTLEIHSVYKGSYEVGHQIEVKQLGGETEEFIYATNAQLDLGLTNDYVFFLQSYDNTPASILNPLQGAYIFNAKTRSADTSLASVSDQNDLTLTYGELQKIADTNKS